MNAKLYPGLQKFINNADQVIHRVTKVSGGNDDYPIGYWVIGYISELEKGKSLKIFRIANSKNCGFSYGNFYTSKVAFIERGRDYDVITTANSTYKLEQLNSVMSVIGKRIRAEGLGED